MLFRKKELACWIEHRHFFCPTVYECSSCGSEFDAEYKRCPNCDAAMDIFYEEALEMLDIMLCNEGD